MSANANFAGLVAFVAEKALKRGFTNVWSTGNPFLGIIRAKKANFNTGYRIEGNKAIIGINFAPGSTRADGVTDANEFVPITPYATSGFTQAEYQFAHYRHAFYIKDSEKQLIQGEGERSPLLQSKVNQLMADFDEGVSKDFASANPDTRDSVIGLRYVLSTSNSPGNISQTTYPVWAAGVRTGAGPFHTGLIDDQVDRINAFRRKKADIAMLSWAPNSNVYGKLRDAIAPAQVLQREGGTPNYGFPTFQYLDLECIQDNRLGEVLPGSFQILSSSSWYVGMKSSEPTLAEEGKGRLPGTDAMEYLYNWWLFVGCDDPACNSLVQDVEV